MEKEIVEKLKEILAHSQWSQERLYNYKLLSLFIAESVIASSEICKA